MPRNDLVFNPMFPLLPLIRAIHKGISALDIAIGQDAYKPLFKRVMRQERQIRERDLVGQRNFRVDLVELFANIGDGEFFEGVHHIHLMVRVEVASSTRTILSVSS